MEDGLRLPLLQPPPDDQPGGSPVAWAIDDALEKGLEVLGERLQGSEGTGQGP